MTERPYPHVLIAGAGLSGLALAQILRKEGVSFEIFERDVSESARSQGWAIALHGPLLAGLKESMPEDIGPIDQTNHLLPLDHLPAQFVFYDANKPGMRIGVNDDENGHIVRANRQRLRDWLRTFIPVQYGKRVARVDDSGEEIVVHFEDGSLASGDILIGAEGTRSVALLQVRKHILHGQDVLTPLPVGSLVGEIELTGADFARQLELGHSAYVVMGDAKDQCSMFAAINKVSPDGKTGHYYFLLHWVDEQATLSTESNPYWAVNASLLVERYRRPGIVLHAVELDASQLPPGRVMLMGDAAHSMTPFRGEAGVCALSDALSLGRTITAIRDKSAKKADLESLMVTYRDEMLKRAAKSISVSNPVIGAYARDPNYKLYTCGKEALPLPNEVINI
ncbi:hypothetical protein ONZ43_g3386 [Nemania bipapillata]|uniref:Uncharacterized protein n=1 Tax=Nemania bipapillata TaxID=110536 RepID=A0ACC2IXD1_9PEZI|nr:hypothetical protein ONZ43_g3386 [Nemania bipapillata]